MRRFIAIAGNIGVGKSELTQRLSKYLGWKAFLEPAVQNPYLADFYQEMRKWAFHSQMFFLAQRLKDHHRLLQEVTSVVQDRSLYENAEIFAKNLWLEGIMSDRDYQSYSQFYQILNELLPPPNLIVYLQASLPTLQQRIAKRGHEYEKKIPPAYLQRLNHLYNEWSKRFKRCPVLTIDTDNKDFVINNSDFLIIIQKITAALGITPLPLKI